MEILIEQSCAKAVSGNINRTATGSLQLEILIDQPCEACRWTYTFLRPHAPSFGFALNDMTEQTDWYPKELSQVVCVSENQRGFFFFFEFEHLWRGHVSLSALYQRRAGFIACGQKTKDTTYTTDHDVKRGSNRRPNFTRGDRAISNHTNVRTASKATQG